MRWRDIALKGLRWDAVGCDGIKWSEAEAVSWLGRAYASSEVQCHHSPSSAAPSDDETPWMGTITLRRRSDGAATSPEVETV